MTRRKKRPLARPPSPYTRETILDAHRPRPRIPPAPAPVVAASRPRPVCSAATVAEPLVVTEQEFLALPPRQRGYTAYMLGERDDQPHVPNEANPYPAESADAREWDEGQRRAVLDAQDADEG